MLLGVALHALIPYMEQPVPHLLWPVREPGGHAFDGLYWWIHGFRVQLFFLISGMLAAASIAKVGPALFARQRLNRLGVPLLMASIVVVAGLMYPVWAWGWVESGLAEPKHIVHVRFSHGMQADLYGLAHLWFLEYLLLYCLLLAAARRFLSRSGPPSGRRPARTIDARRLSAVIMALVAATGGWLMLDPRCLIEFHNWFLPRASEFIYHGLFFAAGVAGWSWQGTADVIGRWWWGPLLAAQAIFPWYLREMTTWSGPGDGWAAALAACYGWASVIGWLGLAVRVVNRAGPVMQFLSTRAFWLYLVHPPLVGVVQVLLFEQPLPSGLKFLTAFAVATAVGLTTYGPAARLMARFWRTKHGAADIRRGTSTGEPVPGP